MRAGVRKVVLLEGVSDIAAVTAAAAAQQLELDDVELVDLGGVTNVQRELIELTRTGSEFEMLGLCDAPEVRFVEHALREIGCAVRDPSDLAGYGFFVCQADLEEELIRALGATQTIHVIEQLGLGQKLATMRQQPPGRNVRCPSNCTGSAVSHPAARNFSPAPCRPRSIPSTCPIRCCNWLTGSPPHDRPVLPRPRSRIRPARPHRAADR